MGDGQITLHFTIILIRAGPSIMIARQCVVIVFFAVMHIHVVLHIQK